MKEKVIEICYDGIRSIWNLFIVIDLKVGL